MKKVLVILLLLTIPSFWALTKPGFFPSHDGEWMVIRLSAFHQALADGQFPVRWSSRLNHGFGYPVLNFLYPLPFYLGEIFYVISGSFSQAIKLVFLFSFPLSALTMYMWLSKKLSPVASLAGSLLYIYTPYRFIDTYVRGSVGESLGFVFVPLIFLSLDLLPKKPYWATILGALSIAATILSHNVFVIFVFLAGIYGLFAKLPIRRLLWMFLLGAALSAYFWFPALYELRYVYASKLPVANPIDHLLTLKHLILPSWNFGPANPAQSSSMSFQLGIINLLILILATWKKASKFFIWTSIVSIILMLQIALPVWKIIPGIAVIQFPWRLLAVTTFTSSALLAIISQKHRLFSLLAFVAIMTTWPYTHPQAYTFVPDELYATNEDTTTVKQEYTPLWVKNFPTERTGRIWIKQDTAVVSELTETNLGMSFKVEASLPTEIQPSIMYYPGWQAIINSQSIPIDYSQNGMVTLTVPKGISSVDIRFRETLLRQITNYLSLITLLAIISHISCTLFWSQSSLQLSSRKLATKR